MKNFPPNCVVILKTNDYSLELTDAVCYRIAFIKDPNEFYRLERDFLHWLGIWMKENFQGSPCAKHEDAESMAGDILKSAQQLGLEVSGIVNIDASKYVFPLI